MVLDRYTKGSIVCACVRARCYVFLAEGNVEEVEITPAAVSFGSNTHRVLFNMDATIAFICFVRMIYHLWTPYYFGTDTTLSFSLGSEEVAGVLQLGRLASEALQTLNVSPLSIPSVSLSAVSYLDNTNGA